MNYLPSRKVLGLALAALGLALVFVTGIAFDLFEQRIDFRTNPALYAFFGSVFLTVFGLGVAIPPDRIENAAVVRFAFIGTVCLSGIYLILFVLGKLARGEL